MLSILTPFPRPLNEMNTQNLCQKKAVDGGIRSARLPIGKYLAEMTSRKVLTVNQVFEILIHWTESRDWEQALYSVVPKRKFQQNQQNGSMSLGSPSSGKEENEKPETIVKTEAAAVCEEDERL